MSLSNSLAIICAACFRHLAKSTPAGRRLYPSIAAVISRVKRAWLTRLPGVYCLDMRLRRCGVYHTVDESEFLERETKWSITHHGQHLAAQMMPLLSNSSRPSVTNVRRVTALLVSVARWRTGSLLNTCETRRRWANRS